MVNSWNSLISSSSILQRLQKRYKLATFVFVAILAIIIAFLLHVNQDVIGGHYVLFAQWGDGNQDAVSIFMLPLTFTAIIFLVFYLNYIKKAVKNSFNLTQPMLSLTEEGSKEIIKKRLTLIFSSKSNIFALAITAAITCFETMLSITSGLVYINWSLWLYFTTMHFISFFLAARCAWIVLTTTYSIYTLSKIDFQADILKLSNWLRSDKLGGIRPLSDLSLRLLVFFIVGVILFSPAPIIYNFTLYAFYLFAVLIAGTIIFLSIQLMLHTRITREKKCLSDLAEKNLLGKDQLDYIIKIDDIKEWPVDFKVTVGLFVSNILWPLIIFYLTVLLTETFKLPA